MLNHRVGERCRELNGDGDTLATKGYNLTEVYPDGSNDDCFELLFDTIGGEKPCAAYLVYENGAIHDFSCDRLN